MVYKIGILFTWVFLAMLGGIIRQQTRPGGERAGTMATGGGYGEIAGGWVNCFSTEKIKKTKKAPFSKVLQNPKRNHQKVSTHFSSDCIFNGPIK